MDIMPKLVYLDFDTNPSGLKLSLDEEIVTTPYRALSWENHNLQVVAPDQALFKFLHWSNGARQNDIFKIPTGISGTDTIRSVVATFVNGATEDLESTPVLVPVTHAPAEAAVPTTPEQQGVVVAVLGNNGTPNNAFPLKQCQSDCDNDDECEGSLVCLQRSGDEPIPGCTGYNRPQFFGLDFCVKAQSASSPSTAPVAAVVPAPILSPPPPPSSDGQAEVLGNNGFPAAVFPLKRCQSDCDSDNECEGDLICFHRTGNEAVPGCVGYEKAQFFALDFCVAL
jgi:hypothetical protein